VRTSPQEPAKPDGPDDAGQRVGGNGQPDKRAYVGSGRDPYGQPGDGDRAEAVAERRRTQARQDQPGTAVREEAPICRGIH
jgi:hypothetical protein